MFRMYRHGFFLNIQRNKDCYSGFNLEFSFCRSLFAEKQDPNKQ